MKTLKESILSSTKTGKAAFLIPKNKNELYKIIKNEIKEKGNNCDLNHIDVSKITDFSNLFSTKLFSVGIGSFNGDISKWDVSNAINMESMFKYSRFNGDISKWDVSNVTNMNQMFAHSNFNNDLSKWKINTVCDTQEMLYGCNIKKYNKPKQDGKIIDGGSYESIYDN